MSNESGKVRLDKYLWAIRLFKTRSLASAAIEAGKVKMNGLALKASRSVGIGDIYELKNEARRWRIQVTALLENRKPYAEAVLHYADLSPEEYKEAAAMPSAFSFNSGKRSNKQSRPTKRIRRQLDELSGNESVS